MLSNLNTHHYFIISILISPFLGYFSNSGIVAYGALILLMMAVIVFELFYMPRMSLRNWIAVLAWLPYVAWAGYYYISNPLDGRYFTTHFLTIIILPVVVLSFLRLSDNKESNEYRMLVYHLLSFFLVGQVLICIGQISTYLTGFGFPVSEAYSEYFMVTGTFSNSNDLGSIVLLLSFIFIGLEKSLSKTRGIFTWFLIISLVLISGSRSTLLIVAFVFILTRKLNIKSIFLYIVSVSIGYVIFNLLYNESGVFARVLTRVQSLVNVLKGGVSVDGSIGLRLDSYFHFIKNIGVLGFGSGEVNNYLKYSAGAQFESELVFINPHSLLIELGYWLGYPGVFLFLLPLIYLFRFADRKLQLILILVISSAIPSSVFGNLSYFLFMLCCFFITPSSDNVKNYFVPKS